MSSYYDDKKNIHVELLDQTAKEIAESFVQRNPNNPGRLLARTSLSSAQLRRFFTMMRQLEKKVKSTKDFNKVKPLIKMMKSKATYAANPGNPKIPNSFKNFLVENIDRIDNEDDFKAFMLHFEAVVGFFYGIEGVSTN